MMRSTLHLEEKMVALHTVRVSESLISIIFQNTRVVTGATFFFASISCNVKRRV